MMSRALLWGLSLPLPAGAPARVHSVPEWKRSSLLRRHAKEKQRAGFTAFGRVSQIKAIKRDQTVEREEDLMERSLERAVVYAAIPASHHLW